MPHLELAFRDVAEDKPHQSGAHHFAEAGRGEGKEIPSVSMLMHLTRPQNSFGTVHCL